MRKLIVAIAAIATLCVAGFGFLVVFTPRGCGCATPPTIPPWPVSPLSAHEAAQRLTDEDLTEQPGWLETQGERLWLFYPGDAADSGVWAAVGGSDGHVLALLDLGAMPSGPSNETSADRAKQAAVSYLAAHGIAADEAATVEPLRLGAEGVRAYLVTSTTAGRVQVAVSASTGRVFWFADLGHTKLGLRPPLVARAEAESRARAIGGESLIADKAWFSVAFGASGQLDAEWSLVLTGPATSEGTASVQIVLDALTGLEATR